MTDISVEFIVFTVAEKNSDTPQRGSVGGSRGRGHGLRGGQGGIKKFGQNRVLRLIYYKI